jgi:hypothetical protein
VEVPHDVVVAFRSIDEQHRIVQRHEKVRLEQGIEWYVAATEIKEVGYSIIMRLISKSGEIDYG